MATFPQQNSRFSTAAFTLSLAVAAVLTSNDAQGSCGYYLQSRNSVSANHQSVDSAGTVVHGFPGRTASDRRDSDRPIQPCSGPGCRQSPASQELPVVPPSTSRLINDHLMIIASTDPPDNRSALRAPPRSDLDPAPGCPQLIEVPPESAS